MSSRQQIYDTPECSSRSVYVYVNGHLVMCSMSHHSETRWQGDFCGLSYNGPRKSTSFPARVERERLFLRVKYRNGLLKRLQARQRQRRLCEKTTFSPRRTKLHTGIWGSIPAEFRVSKQCSVSHRDNSCRGMGRLSNQRDWRSSSISLMVSIISKVYERSVATCYWEISTVLSSRFEWPYR